MTRKKLLNGFLYYLVASGVAAAFQKSVGSFPVSASRWSIEAKRLSLTSAEEAHNYPQG